MDIKFAVMQVLEAEDGIALDNVAERDRLASAIASALHDRLDRIVQGYKTALQMTKDTRDEAVDELNRMKIEKDRDYLLLYANREKTESELKLCLIERDASEARVLELQDQREAARDALRVRTRLDGIVQGHQDALKVARNERDEAIHERDAAIRTAEHWIDKDSTNRLERDASRTWARLWKRAAKRQSKQARQARTWREVYRRQADMHAIELERLRAEFEDSAGITEPPFPMIGVGG